MGQDTKNKTSDNTDRLLYYHPSYLQLQGYKSLKVIQQTNYLICFSLRDSIAQSLPSSPFGGIVSSATAQESFLNFHQHLCRELNSAGIKKIEITQPPFYYKNFCQENWLTPAGYEREITEVSHYLLLQGPLLPRLHHMEKRKLKRKNKFNIEKSRLEALKEVHDFISTCRHAQGLEVSISYEKLHRLFTTFPGNYEIFALKSGQQLASVVITTIPTPEVVYYFLPATHPHFKGESPMVHLIDYLYREYQSRGFEYLDLGISSIGGKPQDGLIRFKENMGAQRTSRITWSRFI